MLDLAPLIPALPLAGFVLLLFWGKRLGEPAAGWIGTAGVFGSFLLTVGAFFALRDRAPEHRQVIDHLYTWVEVGGLDVGVSLLIDQLSLTMALFVTGVGSLIHLYSIGYMHGDPRYSRFFCYLNLFIFSMLTLVLADNFLLMFLGWEGVGTCSYLLISFWFERDSAASAGKKAFVTNRIGDFGLMTAMFLIFTSFGSLEYFGDNGVLSRAEELHNLNELTTGTVTAICLLLFLGAVGKSAQLPLYVWLPDAMEGPTPVSALIHAATMVTAGVYLLARVNPLLDLAPDAATLIAAVGAATALFAATIACAQNDIKRVLAYSTVSQLGYMFLAIGSGAYVAALFHMITHAFFKALLFLGAGSVIHGMHDQQNMKYMGALRKAMPLTAFTFIIGWLAIAGVPPFAGFWSKDEVLLDAYDKHIVLWIVGLLTTLLTAYYMTRQVILVFYGKARWGSAAPASASAAAVPASTDVEASPSHSVGTPHESPWTMTLPLGVLAALAVVAGVVNLPFEGRFGQALTHWLEPVIEHHESETDKLPLALIAIVASALGILIARRLWWRTANRPELEPRLLQRAWYVDPFYAAVIEKPGRALAGVCAYVIDAKIIDGAVNGTGMVVRRTGAQLRKTQTGYVRNYALILAAGSALVLGWFLVGAS